jgi:hypothetical protein
MREKIHSTYTYHNLQPTGACKWIYILGVNALTTMCSITYVWHGQDVQFALSSLAFYITHIASGRELHDATVINKHAFYICMTGWASA